MAELGLEHGVPNRPHSTSSPWLPHCPLNTVLGGVEHAVYFSLEPSEMATGQRGSAQRSLTCTAHYPQVTPRCSPPTGLCCCPWHLAAVKSHTVCLWDSRAETPKHGTSGDPGGFRRPPEPMCTDVSTHGRVHTTYSSTLRFLLEVWS